ncbi:MAG: rhodanese-related sulfurtransferase [Alphaproteobacteria bacterium]
MNYTIAALYRFVTINDTAALRAELKPAFAALDICGTLLIAPEGINGTLAGSKNSIDQMLALLEKHTGLPGRDVKFSFAPEKPFKRLKIRLKREIITFNQPQANPNTLAGTYVEPQDWNKLISDPEVVVLDTRNMYETVIGTFQKAQDPKTECFTDFADYVRENLDPSKHKKIAMYCTGGIRCEKASAFMRAEGFDEVYHLKGGILKYLETIPADESQWNGDCYVFDRRVSVGHGLATGKHTMCFCCGYPVSAQDKEHPFYEEGVSCPHCFDKRSDADKERFRMRQHQVDASDERSA